MKKLIIVAILGSSLSVLVSCSKSLFQSQYRTGMVADGRINDWQFDVEPESKNGRFHYAVSNDKERVNIVFRSFDRLSQAKVLLNGMKLYLDPELTKSRTTYIQFPLPQKNIDSLMAKAQLRPGVRPPAKNLEGFIMSLKHLRLTGFNEGHNGVFALDSTDVKVAISFDDDESLIYEASIPFKAFSKNGVMPTSLGFYVEVDGLKPLNAQEDIYKRMSQRGGMYGGGGAGSYGQGGPNQTDAAQQMKDNIKFELNVKLATTKK
ncbi:hypothetical protein [Solitalea koreensis]|uniref:Lipoprotein n=1 Tax=Solitalea koreensis TaxID=543615 RepID=A0A521AF29_9SPHI|nr:hypothetical protein [Solitalea koreensis]SMO33423.1 hypothetical protein SAMN06265350_101101 [Solitalea koreensis]